MSRTKNAGSVKGYSKLELVPKNLSPEALLMFRYGKDCDAGAVDAIHALHKALNPLEGTIDGKRIPSLDRDDFDTNRRIFWNYVAANYSETDGKVFKKLANAVEAHWRANDPAWYAAISAILDKKGRGLKMFTAIELKQYLDEKGIQIDIKTVRNIFKFCRIKPTPAKLGAPFKTKDK